MDYFLSMEVNDFIPQYIHSRDNEEKDKLWVLYTTVFPNFDNDSFLTFEQFYVKMTGKPFTKREENQISDNGETSEKLVAEAENILFNMEFVEKQ